ncbi:MAG: phage tail tape measure protein [Prevotella sp.]|nr:phage tail tape measure protein [Prevotella sp.]MBO5157271.1 phage tail tape measure protein [Prevotella sp.]
MATTEKYTTVIELNSEQAKRNLEELRRQVQSWKTDLAKAREQKMGKSFIRDIQKELRTAEKELKKYDNEVSRTIETMNDLQSASVERIEAAQKNLKRLASEVPHDSPLYDSLNSQLDQVTEELENIKATKAFEQLQRDAAGATKTFEQTRAEAEFVKRTVESIDTASLKQLKLAEQTARGIKESAQQGSLEYNGAATSLDKIQAKLSDIDAKEHKVVSLTKQYNQAMAAIGQETKKVEDETELINRTLEHLNTASIRDIEFSIKAVKEQLQDTERTGGQVEELTAKLKKLNTELKTVQDLQKPDEKKGNIFSRIVNSLNKNWGAITQAIATYVGLREVVKGSVEAFAEMDQEMANVRKYTGQTTEEVERMNKSFKKMDTRTPREELNQLAGSAGRLGITATAAVQDYVDAADKIQVSLGDDLGDGAVDQIGKLTLAFGEDKKKGLRGAMLATGSAVNELAQNSSAQAGYLVDFTARLSGIGIQADLTQAQIMGFGAAMDENMQKDEMAATALSQIITKMTTDSEVFARIAGKNVEEFAKLVKTDMNEALLQFFDTMNKKGGFTELAPLFEQMGLDGTRAIGVLSTLASKVDDVRKHQNLANEAYEKGTSVIEEFNVQNNTYQAQIDKAKKNFQDLRIELGEKLLPVASVAISTTSMMVRVLKTIIDFVTQFRTTIALLTFSLGVLTAAKYKNIAATKLQIFWNNMVVASFKKLRAALLANSWTAATLGVVALVGVIADLTRRSREAIMSQKAMGDIEHDATVKAEIERNKIEQLTKKIHDNSLSIDERRGYIEELQKIVPDYVAKISEEGRVYEESTEALDKYIQKIKEKAMIDGAKSKMEELAAERAELIAEKMRLNEEIQKRKQEEANRQKTVANTPQTSSGAFAPSSVHANMGASAEIAATKSKLDDIDAKITEADNTIEILGKVAKDNVQSISEATGNKPAESKSNYDTRSYWEAELKARRDKLKQLRDDAKATAADIEKADQAVKEAESKMETFTGAKAGAKANREQYKIQRENERRANDAAKAETEQQLAELTHRYAMGKILYCDYIDEQERIQLEGIERQMLVYKTESLEYQKLSRQREELLLNGSEESRKLTLAKMKQDHEQRIANIEEQAWRENMTEQQKNEIIFREDMRFMDEQRILYRKGTLERINLENDIETEQQQHKIHTEQYYEQQLIQIREQYLNKANTKVMDLALKNLEELHEQGKLSEIEYQEALLAIKAQYANYETNNEHDQQVAGNMLKVAQDKAKQQLDESGSKSANLPIIGDIMLYKATMEQLKVMYADDENNHAAYLAAKREATAQFCQGLAEKFQAAYQAVNQIMSAASSYYSAQQEYETAQVQKKYEKQIEAAGNNQKKVKKLQEKQAKEEAAIKTKYAKKAAAIQMAQALAQTAMAAINAYASAAAVPVVGHILAPIAAAAATAAGMLQIATIKKQQQAQEAGYYEGGFTGGNNYRRRAGIVHEGEFVANHQAVNNPAILPVLNFLDQAQRNNTVGSLTAQDVSRNMGGVATATQIMAPVVNVTTDNAELREAIEAQQAATVALLDRLSEPIEAQMVMHDFDRDYTRYKNLLKNK